MGDEPGETEVPAVEATSANQEQDQAQAQVLSHEELLAHVRAQPGTALVKARYIDFTRFSEKFKKRNGLERTDKQVQEKRKEPEAQDPEAKKKKMRGQNKNRPRDHKVVPHEERPCLDFLKGASCRFGDKCKFSHDIPKLMVGKDPDIGPRCLHFDRFGTCPFGLLCRFGGAHIDENLRSIVDEEKVKETGGKFEVINILSKDLQIKLRKRKVQFKKYDQYMKSLGTMKKGAKKNQGPHSKDHVNNEAGLNQASTESSLRLGNTKDGTSSDLNQSSPNGESHPVAMPTHDADHDHAGTVTDEDVIKLRQVEKRKLDVKNKLLLAPLTTVGNLPYRAVCKKFGADITCGEMAMCTNLLQGQTSEWALLKRHPSEDVFGVQTKQQWIRKADIKERLRRRRSKMQDKTFDKMPEWLCGGFPDTMTKCAELLNEMVDIDFIDINVGCPIDLVYHKGAGSGLMNRMGKFQEIVRGMSSVLDVPLTVKMRTGVHNDSLIAHKIIPRIYDWGASVVTVHGRTREQRYSKVADWDYLKECAKAAHPHPFIGNGDILSYEDANLFREQSGVTGQMIARGALIKPWIFTEIKEQRHWDISSRERFDILQDYVNLGLLHWGSDSEGVRKTRRFLLEWLSFLHRYIPVGLLERLPQRINERPPYFVGRDDLETLMASANCADWVKISEMFLGPVPDDFQFLPKHKANSYK